MFANPTMGCATDTYRTSIGLFVSTLMQILQKRATKQKLQAILTLSAALTLLSLLTRGGVERNPGPSTQEIMDRVWRNEQAIDSVVRERSKALERERILAEEFFFFFFFLRMTLTA